MLCIISCHYGEVTHQYMMQLGQHDGCYDIENNYVNMVPLYDIEFMILCRQ